VFVSRTQPEYDSIQAAWVSAKTADLLSEVLREFS
jgi:hypothetical protein